MKSTLLVLTLSLIAPFANASVGQWAREVSAHVAREAGMTEHEGVPLYANICGRLDTHYLIYDVKTGESYSLGMSQMPSMESADRARIGVKLVNIADCQVLRLKIKGM